MSSEIDPAKVRKKKGKCRNFEGGECVKAELGEIQEIPENELFICQDCKQPLTELPGSGGKATIPLILGGVGLVVASALAVFLSDCRKPIEIEKSISGFQGEDIQPFVFKQDPIFEQSRATQLEPDPKLKLPEGISVTMDMILQGAPTQPGEQTGKLLAKNENGKTVLIYTINFRITPAREAPPVPAQQTTSPVPVANPIPQPPIPGGGVEKASEIGSVFFEQGSDELNDKALEDIENAARKIERDYPDDPQIILMGFASREGREDSNKVLATSRGNAVRKELEPKLSGKKFVILEGTIPAEGTAPRDYHQDRRVDIQVSR
jgi:outer membrane protein OmpA-like peptidoglycan-associated protein